MYLQKLALAGFKSFAHKSSLTFTRGITAIVGPNGSGKSNVADAIRWVLGEQSLKVLRGKKSEDVIFAGSDTKTRLGLAEVALLLNNEDGNAPVDYAEVEITRRIDRSGSGDYLLNRGPVRLQDIQLLLAKCNFGQRTYSVIGQGMVESFLTTSSTERKELFDDAAGVRQYQIKREQAVLKLGHAKDNLHQAEILMVEIEPRLRSLTRAVRRLERREEVEQELRGFQVTFFARKLNTILEVLGKGRGNAAEFEGQKSVIEKEVQTIQQELAALERAQSREERFVELQKTYNAILDEKNDHVREQSALKGHREAAAVKQGSLDRVIVEQRIEDIDRTLQRMGEELEAADRRAQADQQRLAVAEQEFSAQVARIATVEDRLRAIQGTLASEPVRSFADIRKDVQGLLMNQDELIAALGSLQDIAKVPSLLREAKRIQDGLRTLAEALEGGDVTAAAHELLALQTEFAKLQKLKDELADGIRRQSVAAEGARGHAQHLRERQAELAAERNRLEARAERMKSAPVSGDAAYQQYLEEKKILDGNIAALDGQLQKVRQRIASLSTEEQAAKDRLFALQKHFRDGQQSLTAVANRLNEVRIEIAKLETRQADLEAEMRGELPPERVEEIFAQIERKSFETAQPEEELENAILRLKHSLELVGGIEEGTTEEYRATKERFDFLSTQSKDLTKAIGDLESAIADLDATIKGQFQEAFEAIDKKFSTYFRTLFSGGTAKLVLVKEDAVSEPPEGTETEDGEETEAEEPAVQEKPAQPREKIITGVEIHATPPGKRLKSITMLSGGERALTSIALICAIIASNPSPFVVLDEVDAALDEANSQRFAAILTQLAEKTQFIIISHNRATMEKAHTLYGVTMGDDGISKLLSVNMEEAEKVIKTHGNR